MSKDAHAPQAKINLRRPDIMEAVSADVLSHYRSELVENIRANGGVLSAGSSTPCTSNHGWTTFAADSSVLPIPVRSST